MAGNIFINYRRDESGHVAGRLHDSLAPTFGRNKLFMDVDNIPVGKDFEDYLKSQVAACDAMLAIIGPNWLAAKDEAGQRQLDNPEDFIVIEIGAALARDIPVVPVLVDGARMPKASELPDSLKRLVRRQAVEVRHTNFSRDAEALVKKLREVLGYDLPGRRWRVRATIGAAAVAVLLLIGWGGYELILYMKADIEEAFRDVRQRAELDKQAALEAAVKAQQELQTKHQAEQAEQQRVAALKAEEDRRAKAAAEAEEKRKADEAERQRLAAVKAEQERQARAAAEAEEKRKAEETERQRLAAVRAEEDRRAKAAAEAEEKRKAEEAERQRLAKAEQERQAKAEQERQAKAEQERTARAAAAVEEKRKADETERQRLGALKAENERFIDDPTATYNDAFRRGLDYGEKGDYDQAIHAFYVAIDQNRAMTSAYLNRGVARAKKGDDPRAITDYNQAIALRPDYGPAYCYRGWAKLRINDNSGYLDIAKAKQLGVSFC